MFSGMKMEEFMESENPGIFRVELVTKNVVFGSSETHFMHLRIKNHTFIGMCFLFTLLNLQILNFR